MQALSNEIANDGKQAWFADDSSAVRSLEGVKKMVRIRDQLIYRPIFRFYQYIGIVHVIGLNRSWQNAVICLTHLDNLRKKAQRSKSRQWSNNTSRCGFINKTDKINHGACVSRHNRNKSIIGKLRNAWSHHVQVLCANKLPLYFRKFSQHEKFDWYLRCRSPIDA